MENMEDFVEISMAKAVYCAGVSFEPIADRSGVYCTKAEVLRIEELEDGSQNIYASFGGVSYDLCIPPGFYPVKVGDRLLLDYLKTSNVLVDPYVAIYPDPAPEPFRH
ncbi:MAG: hypothetical protein LBQ75_06305 [Zoogloeaceae bacterium]|jgi:hypothetical protein|nr:hypothetical protein [Zoogloeaceae bacterium]